MQDGTISNGQISASSERRKDFGPANARLNFSGTGVKAGAWVTGTQDPNQWLQVDFGNVTIVTGIDTQGRTRHLCGGCGNWVKKYTVSHSLDNATFHQYKENGNRVKVHIAEKSLFRSCPFYGCHDCSISVFRCFLHIKEIPSQLGPRVHRPSRVESPRCGAVHPHQSDRVERFHRHEGGVPGVQSRFGLLLPPPPPPPSPLSHLVWCPLSKSLCLSGVHLVWRL